jgi:hypothetical protein
MEPPCSQYQFPTKAVFGPFIPSTIVDIKGRNAGAFVLIISASYFSFRATDQLIPSSNGLTPWAK